MISDFRQVWKLVLSEKKAIILASLIGVVAAMASIGLMSMGGYLISAAALHPPLYSLTMVILAVRFFGLLRAGSKYFERYYAHKATFSILARVRAYYYERIEPYAPGIYMRQRRGDILARMVADVESLQFFFLRILYPPIVMFFVFLLTAIMLVYMSWIFVIILYCGLIIVGLLLPVYVYRLTADKGKIVRDKRAELSSQAVELTNGYLDLLYTGQLQYRITHLETSSEKLIAEQSLNKKIESYAESSALLGSFITSWFILVAGVIAVSRGEMKGVFLAFVVLAVMTAFEVVGPVVSMPVYIDETRVAMSRLGMIGNENKLQLEKTLNKSNFDQETTSKGPISECVDIIERDFNNKNIIDFNKVTFSYPESNRNALREISFSIKEQEKIGIVGPSGSGKSTIFHLLLQFYSDYEGRISLYGRELSAYTAEESRKLFSVVAQDNHFFHNSVRNNLLLANPEISDDELIELLLALRLSHISLDASIAEAGMALSGGERQRLAIARMLLKDAPIILLDEMTTGLDGITKKEVMDDIWPFIKDKTILYISHNINDLDKMDKIIKIENGEISRDN